MHTGSLHTYTSSLKSSCCIISSMYKLTGSSMKAKVIPNDAQYARALFQLCPSVKSLSCEDGAPSVKGTPPLASSLG